TILVVTVHACGSANYVKLLSGRDNLYPIEIDLEKTNYSYESPEKAVSSLMVALYQGDKDAFLGSMSADAKNTLLKAYEEGGIDFESIHIKEQKCSGYVLLDEYVYKDVVFVIVEKKYEEKPSFKYPVTVVLEDGLWKQTQKFSADQRMQDVIQKLAAL
ncbi:hypothetical protein K8I31_00540, partial [bacterium]|nr:hypothetical protein [bacterium]